MAQMKNSSSSIYCGYAIQHPIRSFRAGHRVERYRCPRCGEATVTFWQKQLAGAAAGVRCSACGARLAVPAGRAILVAAVAIIVPMLAAISIYAAGFRHAGPVGDEIWRIYGILLIGLLLGGILAIWARHRFVSLTCIDGLPAADPGALAARLSQSSSSSR